jgi:hypothetical protein
VEENQTVNASLVDFLLRFRERERENAAQQLRSLPAARFDRASFVRSVAVLPRPTESIPSRADSPVAR